VRAVLGRLELVLLGQADAAAVAEPGLLEPVGHHVLGHVGGVGHALDVADLVPVVGGDRDLGDPHARVVQLDDDLGVEVEAVRVLLERDPLEGVHRVGPVAGVEFAELGTECGVLEPRQDPVAQELVERHAPLAGGPLDHGPGPEDGVRLAPEQGLEQVGHRLGGVLAVPVEHDHDVQPVLDGQVVAGLLVAPVPQVPGLADQGDRELGHLLVSETDQVGRVLAVVVGDHHLLDVVADLGGDAVEGLGQRGRGVVRHHEDTDALRRLRHPALVPSTAAGRSPRRGSCPTPILRGAIRPGEGVLPPVADPAGGAGVQPGFTLLGEKVQFTVATSRDPFHHAFGCG